MYHRFFDRFWHQVLHRRYTLAVPIDIHQYDSYTVVLLHGIGSSSSIWSHLVTLLEAEPCRILALDLLGFGQSPKPEWANYSTDDHAQAVIKTLQKYRLKRKPVILVGHSMGCLVAVRVAKLRPDLISQLILYQPPLYVGLPDTSTYKLRRDVYFWLYRRVLANPIALTRRGLLSALVKRTGLALNPDNLVPFVRSLSHTIMEQSTLSDMAGLRQPIDIIYGSLDLAVIRGNRSQVFAEVLAPLQTHTILNLHIVSPRASKFIAGQIKAAANLQMQK